ncbi:RagB/SusD family nutrient uptake outer membrane protein [Dyadobacter subterraneus]|uniref:RagB/SusD family nutrient uptake outer membrane protein n=1 Tax=Dyadobacter subterraneus TaxID=2773304 RepID=A0ABR9WE50_9BACT|nr:RagB/SusD family nutrient uptake outer membrane protein [Dyadobacter subterraneus]MBE9463769.1 RagB/SusD family nutrient uptake outer membrane protein [Dyadobacter subterraneus]
MKLNSIKLFFSLGMVLFCSVSCEQYFQPTTTIDETTALANESDVQTVTTGTYALLINANYTTSGHYLMEYPSDEIAQGQISSNDLTRLYRYTHINTSTHATAFWSQAYKVIAAANKVIAFVPDNASDELKQLKGENLFLRAMVHFNLVRMFGRPYPQNAGANPGVPILHEAMSDEQLLTISRSSVKEVYDFVINDLVLAASLMGSTKTNIYASKEVAYALLSKVYLFKEDNANALKYANLVLDSKRYTLVSSSELPSYFKKTPETNTETIFAVRHTNVQIAGIGTMYISSDQAGNPLGQGVSGWAELYASKKYVDFIGQHPEDIRKSFVIPYVIGGSLQYNQKLTPATPMYYIDKFTLQENVINASSPVYLRLADIYLIRAEANAKLGNTQAALADVNLIRTRAGLSGSALHTQASMSAQSKTALDLVLEERYLELAFEGHRVYDLFRNNLPMVRNYPGTHAQNNTPTTDVRQTVLPTDPRVVYYIPQAEINQNSNLIQNP